MSAARTPILYIAAQVNDGETAQSAVDWFENLDPSRWAPSLVTTQPSPNRRLSEIERYACEVWDLPDLMPGDSFPQFILGFIESRNIDLLQIVDARLGFDLLPDIACLPRPPVVVARLHDAAPDRTGYVRYVTRRYGNLVDAFSVTSEKLRGVTAGYDIPPSRIAVIGDDADTGEHHGELYARLLAARPARSRWLNEELFGESGSETGGSDGAVRDPLVLPRTPLPERSVGIVVPCYRHGIFLPECIESIKAQTLTPARVVVVDDGSDDPETVAALAELDGDETIEVIRQEVNRGPSAARNRALDALDTNYVLPIDADDKLLPDALERMLAQLEAAPEDVGFIYPHAQHFGNRDDFVRLPAYNLWLLMRENYCPAPALFDRRLFAPGGVRYPEDIVVGHEDWDLVLQLAERGVLGRHADGPTFLYRRQGFSRVNAVDYGPHEFHQAIERRHPRLYRSSDSIKAAWAPAFSAILLDEGDGWSADNLPDLGEQSCGDFEVLAKRQLADGVRVVGEGAPSPAEWLQQALDAARGRWICVLSPGASGVWSDRSFIEHMLYGFVARKESHAVALGRVDDLTRPGLTQLGDEERQQAEPVGVAFERRAAIELPDVEVSDGRPLLVDLVTRIQAHGVLQWRLARGVERRSAGPTPAGATRPTPLRLNLDRGEDRSEFATRDLIAHEAPRLPELMPGTARRWQDEAGWTPPGTRHLCRHISEDGKHLIVANHRYSPPGYSLEFDLGTLHLDASPGMRRLVHANHSFELIDDQNMLDEERHGLGYVEQEPLPQMEELELRTLPATGQQILVAGAQDPLYEVAEPVATLGWIEPFPLNPRPHLTDTAPWGAIPLRRSADHRGFRHSYSAGEGEGVKLGCLFPWVEGDDLVELRLRADGRLASELGQPGRTSRDPRRLARWVAAPPATDAAAARSAPTRLGFLAGSYRERRLIEDGGGALGGLRRAGGPNLYPLFSTTHPVTGDQLVTCKPREAMDRGYLLDGVLGYIHTDLERQPDLRD